MQTYKQQIYQTLLWLLPTGVETALYAFFCFITLILSSSNLIKNFLYFSGNFNPIRAATDSINQLILRLVGERIAGSLSLAIFWGLVGLFINVLWWVFSNFSTELNNDLVFSGYVHPRSSDPKQPLKEFIVKSLIRFSVGIVLVFYINFVVRDALPATIARYGLVISDWSKHKHILLAILTFVFEILMFHAFVVLVRLITLRKQVFSR
jgi:hypothetical protein